ncbi:UDP-N-acetylmuramoyl-L-alanyl-D-glutamate synthetase [Gracilibacillus halophilus YIM-C55.5]|uniref:UDP-N-acetylmuramoylalanine--D-glutamate ligase n=1 Tax=Gracilibacillus halophilus YIM-C55.5 TaxID=1308866 RepID=N4WVB9_9BACI|nr:UDP-N-acetylmuramoyl-L-alanine--D-glutamate ligase [Gracilibacillus halophilus]ENH98330.1 UDP-N-acetylmuramoyl-L-alanyl-D-glutamate synthetase [Gracilibacillus halophilus YIM-C55.5]
MNKLRNFPYQRVLVLGLAKSGTAVSKLLANHQIEVVANDLKASTQDTAVQELMDMGIDIELGHHSLSLLERVDVVIKNPGIPYHNSLIDEAIRRGIPVITEVELMHYMDVDSLVGITGSNGKTTTTSLIYEMVKTDEQPVQIAGNIGFVASEIAAEAKSNEALIVELSSFQLQGITRLKLDISVLLNIFEAHLDFHHTLENYMEAKANIFKNQTADDVLVYNADDQLVLSMIEDAEATCIPFSMNEVLLNGTYCSDGAIFYQNERVIDVDEIVLVGQHNLENILAAVSVAKAKGVRNQSIQSVLQTFTGVRHRLQYVSEVNGRFFYNDSKATNILATSKALRSFRQPVILLAGGLDRGNGFDDLLPYVTNVKAMVLFGQTAFKLASTAEKAGIQDITIVETMEEAVASSYNLSQSGDVILLSPACASWDQYRTFEERGDMFVNFVHKL